MKTKAQRVFAIVNIIMGVVLTLASFALFGDPSVGPGGIITLALGGLLWGVGAWTLNTLKTMITMRTESKRLAGGTPFALWLLA